MPSYLFTFRSHVSEPKLFNTFLTIFFNSTMFKDFQEYTFNIEKDNTLDQHLHIFFTSKHRDKEKVMKSFSVKEFKQFSQYLKNKATQKQYGFDVRLVGKSKDKDDRLYTIGYCNKEAKHQRDNLPPSCSINISPEVLKGVEYYSEYTKLEKLKLQDDHDIKVLTSKNIHIHILDFLETKKIQITDSLLFEKMAVDGLFTDFITTQQKTAIIKSLHIYTTQELPTQEVTHCYFNTSFSEFSKTFDENVALKKRIQELEQQLSNK